MVKNPKALMTMVRNRLASLNEDTLKWFHEKGITVNQKGDIYYLKSDPRGHVSELTAVCNNIIFHGGRLIAFPGWPIKETSWTELQNDKTFILNENTIFISPIDDGHTVYMYFDVIDKEWRFTSPKKIKSPHESSVKKIIKNIMSGEYCYTYTLKLVETGENKGLYLESIFNHETFKEEKIDRVVFFAQKFNIKYPKLYRLEKNNTLEKEDLPVIARDISGHKYKINEI